METDVPAPDPDQTTIEFIETRSDQTQNPIGVVMHGLEARCGRILDALGYEFRARLTEGVVFLSVHGPVRPGRSGPVDTIASMAAPNDGHTYRPAGQLVVVQAYHSVFPVRPEGVH